MSQLKIYTKRKKAFKSKI